MMTADPNADACGQSPPGYPGIACMRSPGHGGRHESEGHWWSERQQAPVRKGHIHSEELFCMPVCPGYRERATSDG